MIDFPSPILSVSPDVLKELDGEDALYGMWTVFTKCKESLKDGRRLENLSWRLWHREMSHSPSSDSVSSGSSSPSHAETRCASPITPISETGTTQEYFTRPGNSSRDSLSVAQPGPTRHSWHGEDALSPYAATRRLSTASMPVRPRTRSSSSQRVGSIILDILPSTVVVPQRTHTFPGARKAPTSGSGTARASPVSLTGSISKGLLAQPKPQIALPTVQLPSTPPHTGAPQVVVVNPTPHPTPPATPQPAQTTAGAATLAPPVPAPTFLAPPARPVLSLYQPAPAVPPPTAPAKADAPSAGKPSLMAPQVSAVAAPTSSSRNDETLKPSDRRFFLLQASESPDRDSPERPTPQAQGKADDTLQPSPSNSATSSRSHAKSDAPAPRRTMSKQTLSGRRGKEAPRFTATRTTSKAQLAQRPAMQKRANEPKKTTFNIGSASSNGTSRDGHGPEPSTTKQKSPLPHQSKAVPKPRPPSPAKAAPPAVAAPRKGLVMCTSSEYTTDSDDDSEWASEDNSANSADEKEKERQKEETRLRVAAEEAQRQRDLFAKMPKRSYSNLNRTKSGLLSQLLNPDPTIFPPSHPYRTTQSTQDITQLAKQGGRLPQPNHLTSKSSAAMPVATQIAPLAAQVSPSSGTNQPYRPKGRPQGAEMESDSEDEQDSGLQVSQSLAQKKLAELAGPSRRRTLDQASQPQPQPQPQPRLQPQQQPRAPAARASTSQLTAQVQGHAHALPTVATAPIPLGHPYNLPAPAPPSTPRTTRRQMLATELSESLRRNLLWERQVSKMNATSGARRVGLLGSRLQPMTAVNSPQQQQQQGGSSSQVDEREERRKAHMTRNRSWAADDYHASGW